ncbi:hypothetical protein BJV77DRAFT_1071535 [Russula vinacea]|nr:hypothetical protein BJV77DRAFT_1071535 [Russula vinacea]
MPPKASVPRKKNGQFAPQVGQPPSSLAERVSCPSLPARAASPSHVPPRPQSSFSDYAPVFGTRSRSVSPTVPARGRSHSPSLDASDFPTSMESTDVDKHLATAQGLRVPTGYDTTLQFLPTLVSRPRPRPNLPGPPPFACTPHYLPTHQIYYAPPPPAPLNNQLPGPVPTMPQTYQVPPLLPPVHMPHAAPTGPAAMPSARSSRAPQFTRGEDEVLSEFLRE